MIILKVNRINKIKKILFIKHNTVIKNVLKKGFTFFFFFFK